MPPRPWLASAIGAAVAATVLWVTPGEVLVVGAPLTMGVPIAASATVPTRSDPPLSSLVLPESQSGYTVVPSGPTNGTLTPTEFASQSSSPRQASEDFKSLATEPGFAAFIRLWTDSDEPGPEANDVALLLFRIPRIKNAEAFAVGLRTPFEDPTGSTPFVIPGVPGAHGYSVEVSSPVYAVEQIVVFRAGEYVVMAQLASSAFASSPAVLSPSQAIVTSERQYDALRKGDPRGTSGRRAPPLLPNAISAPSGAYAPPGLVALALVVLAVGCTVAVHRRRRSRSGTAPSTAVDPWGPNGIFESFAGAVPDDGCASGRLRAVPADPPGPVSPSSSPGLPNPPSPRAPVAPWPSPQTVPTLVVRVPAEVPDDDRGAPTPPSSAIP
jgi:hypothetical protein